MVPYWAVIVENSGFPPERKGLLFSLEIGDERATGVKLCHQMSVDLPAVSPLEVGWVGEGTVAFPPTELGRLGRLRVAAASVVWDRRSDRGRGVAVAAAAAGFDSV